MCDADKLIPQIGNLMAAIEPTLVGLEADTGFSDTPTGQELLTAFSKAQADCQAWVPGTSVADTEEALNDFLGLLQSVGFPADAQLIVGTIVVGIEGVLGILDVNKSADPIQQQASIAIAEAKIQTKVPGWKLGWMDRTRAKYGDTHVAENHYHQILNEAVDKSDPKYAHLKVA